MEDRMASGVTNLPQEQTGVQKAKALSALWTRKALAITYAGLILTIFVNRFEVYTNLVYNAFATSAFEEHSLLNTAGVVSDITRLCAYPLVAKLSDVFGRGESFSFAVVFLVLGCILYAACPNIETYLVAGIFDAIGDTALLITEQIFIADTTSLINRGFWSAIPEATTSIFALYVGSIVAQSVLDHSTWRWGYGMWCIIIPVCATPLIVTLMVYERRAIRQLKEFGYLPPRRTGSAFARAGRFVWFELDILGAILLAAGFSLILVPLSLTGSYSSSGKWSNGGFIAMVVVGVVCLVLFCLWDGLFARKPIMAYRLLKNRTVIAGCLIGAFDFASYSVFTLLFPSYLQIAASYSAGEASRVSNSLIVAYQVARIITGILLRLTKRPNLWIFSGVPLCMLGQGLMIHFCNMPGGVPANKAEFVTSKVIVGVGRGMYHTASQVSVQAVVLPQDVAVTTAIFLSFMTIGSSIGQSIGGAIWRHIQPDKLEKYLPASDKSSATSIYGSIVVAKKYSPGTPARDAINRAFRESTRTLAVAATAILAPALIIMFLMKNISLKEEQRPRGDSIDDANTGTIGVDTSKVVEKN